MSQISNCLYTIAHRLEKIFSFFVCVSGCLSVLSHRNPRASKTRFKAIRTTKTVVVQMCLLKFFIQLFPQFSGVHTFLWNFSVFSVFSVFSIFSIFSGKSTSLEISRGTGTAVAMATGKFPVAVRPFHNRKECPKPVRPSPIYRHWPRDSSTRPVSASNSLDIPFNTLGKLFFSFSLSYKKLYPSKEQRNYLIYIYIY